MDKFTYKLYRDAKAKDDISMMKALYNGNRNNDLIAFEYSKMLLRKRWVEEARPILMDLLETNNRCYALLELGRLEFMARNMELARYYLVILLKEGTKKDKYFAKITLGKIEACCGNIELARKYFNELLSSSIEKERSNALLELGRLEYSQGKVEKAKSIFNSLVNSSISKHALLCLMQIFIKLEQYSEAYKCFTILLNRKEKLTNSFYYLLPYIAKGLNVEFDFSNVVCGYNSNQVFDYDEYVAIEHIIEEHKDEFLSDVDIYRLFNDVKSKLVDDYVKCNLDANNTYYIPYPNIGNDCDVLKVVTLPNSKDILTMFPVSNSKIYFEEDLDDNSSLNLRRVK